MDFIKDLFLNRRGWAFLVPVVVVGLQRAGIVATDAQVSTALDQGAALLASGLALWSLRRPKA